MEKNTNNKEFQNHRKFFKKNDHTGQQKKEREFFKIAKGLGIALPACLFAIGTANAATTTTTRSSELPSVFEKLDQCNDVFSRLMANVTNYSSDNFVPNHTDVHTNIGGNHSDHHSDRPHTDNHNDFTRGSNEQCVHTNKHTNSSGYNQHTNSGNPQHTDRHSNRDIVGC